MQELAFFVGPFTYIITYDKKLSIEAFHHKTLNSWNKVLCDEMNVDDVISILNIKLKVSVLFKIFDDYINDKLENFELTFPETEKDTLAIELKINILDCDNKKIIFLHQNNDQNINDKLMILKKIDILQRDDISCKLNKLNDILYDLSQIGEDREY